MTDQVTAMRQNVARQRSARRAAVARRINQLKAQQRRTYATHIHSPIKGGGIFGDENVVGMSQPQMPAPLAIDAAALRSAVATVAASPAMQTLTGPAKAARVYQAVRTQLGVQPSTAFRLAFREAYKQVAPTAVAQARSPRRAPAYGGPAAPGSIRPPAAARVVRPPVEFQDPMQGAPMMVKPIPQAPQPEPMEEITDQWAGMVGGIFGGTIFS